MSLFSCSNPTDTDYISLLESDSPQAIEERACLEKMWQRYMPYADPHFIDQIGRDFHRRAWEMRVGLDLLNMGHELIPTRGKGPDFLFFSEGKKVWIEACMPSKGVTEDRVPEIIHGVAQDLPDRALKLRYTSIIREKYAACYSKHLEEGLISKEDLFILAISGHLLGFGDFGDKYPLIVKSVYGIGNQFFIFDKHTDSVHEGGYERSSHTTNHNQQEVQFESFWSNEYSGLTGIIFSSYVLNKPSASYPIEDYVYIENYGSKGKIPSSAFENWLQYGVVNETTVTPFRRTHK